jgi:uncharacterized repeat protein (TIGR01451 family)
MRKLITLLKMVLVCFLLLNTGFNTPAAAQPQAIQAPVLKWQRGGCYASWCETGWYSSPAVADLDQDGVAEVIGSAYTIFVLDGRSGALKWKMPSGYDRGQPSATSVGRTWPGMVVADVDGDGGLEIVSAHSGGVVSVYNSTGYFEPGWPKRPVTEEFRSLAVADIDQNGDMEIAIGRAKLASQNVWVYDHSGSLRAGWPQLNGAGSAAGIYNNNIAIGSLGGGSDLKVVVPSDTITICAYTPTGSQLTTNPIYHGQPGHDMTTWCSVPAYVNPADEIQGWGPCYDGPTSRANFADGPANIVDVNGDGVNEVVALGNVHNCNTSPYIDLYMTPYIFNADRSRLQAGGYDWTTPPLNTGAPLSEDYNLIETAAPNPVTVDLDGDGKLEILYATYDGRLHAIWLDKTEHGSWPYQVKVPAESFIRFASEPVVADLNNDGQPEVIFASWTQKGSGTTGKLTILDSLGNKLQEVSLPMWFGSGDWNGAMAAPTLADIDGDYELEVVLNTAHSGLVAYDLPGTANARILWGTGRGSYQRTGSVLAGSLTGSGMSVTPAAAPAGAKITYTITLRNPGAIIANVQITDTLPSDLIYSGNLSATSGSASQLNGTITWTGNSDYWTPVIIKFDATLNSSITEPRAIINTVNVNGGAGSTLTLQALVIVNGLETFLPSVHR